MRAALRLGALAGAALACCAAASAKTPVTMSFHSRPDLTPPVVVVTTRASGVAPGFVFIAPKKGAIQKGPEIFDERDSPSGSTPCRPRRPTSAYSGIAAGPFSPGGRGRSRRPFAGRASATA